MSDGPRTVGVADPGGPTAAQLCSRLRAAGHETFRLVADPAWRPHWSDRLVASWTGRIDDLVRPPAQVIAVADRGGAAASAAAARRFPTASLVQGRSSVVDLADQFETLLALADADIEVPRVLGSAARPVELPGFLATDGPVVLRHRHGPEASPARACRGIDELTAVVGALAPGEGRADWYLQELVAGDDVVVPGVFRAGEPICWAAQAVDPGRRVVPRPLDADAGARALELAADAAEVLGLDGPARLELRRNGTDVRLIGITPGVSPELVVLGTAGRDDPVVAALVDPTGAPVAGALDAEGGPALPTAYRLRSRLARRGS